MLGTSCRMRAYGSSNLWHNFITKAQCREIPSRLASQTPFFKRINRRMTGVRVREYAGPLGILAAGVLGFGLLCSASALAMNDLNSHNRRNVEPPNLVDLAVANLNTSVALTQQAVTAFVSTPTTSPTNTASLTPTPLPSKTSLISPSFTPRQPTRTRRARPADTATSRPIPTHTKTPLPPSTDTPLPTDSQTPLPPPTDTPLPPPTNTEPPPTDTPPPPATDTQLPPTDPPILISTVSP